MVSNPKILINKSKIPTLDNKLTDSFNELEKIAREYHIHILEEGKDKNDLDSFTFYQELNHPKENSIKICDKYVELIGRIIYSSINAGLDFDNKTLGYIHNYYTPGGTISSIVPTIDAMYIRKYNY